MLDTTFLTIIALAGFFFPYFLVLKFLSLKNLSFERWVRNVDPVLATFKRDPWTADEVFYLLMF
jgi:hypothetical protein